MAKTIKNMFLVAILLGCFVSHNVYCGEETFPDGGGSSGSGGGTSGGGSTTGGGSTSTGGDTKK